MDSLAANIAIAVCWGSFVLIWAVGAVYNAIRGPHRRTHDPRGTAELIGTIAVCAVLALAGRPLWEHLVTEATWVRVLGFVILLPSTAFNVWARLTLGTMWTLSSVVKQDHQLRTDGPYGITRHPIYTGLLGMVLGTTLLAGIGQLAPLFPVGVILLELKIRGEERLLLVAFPDEYPRYRRQVPQLIPGLFTFRRHQALSP